MPRQTATLLLTWDTTHHSPDGCAALLRNHVRQGRPRPGELVARHLPRYVGPLRVQDRNVVHHLRGPFTYDVRKSPFSNLQDDPSE